MELRPMGNAMQWLWRITILALVAWGTWGIWWQATLLEEVNAELVVLVDLLALDYEPVE
jgi:hypothetical protein